VIRYQTWWTALVYPVFWVAVDTLMAALLPDGDWGSLAYTQSDFLPILQTTSLFGTAGVLFLVCLVPSTLALAFAYGKELSKGWRAYGGTILLVGASIAYGVERLQQPVQGKPTMFGLVAIDDAIGLQASASYIKSIWDAYDRHIASLRAQGAEIIVLPEKIGMVRPETAEQWRRHLSERAAQNHAWIEAGVGIDDGKSQTNVCWLFAPEGTLVATYQKHHLAPPERHQTPPYIAGEAFELRAIDGHPFGLAICKDMHFASLGQAYGIRGVSTMLVPAWDFDLDGWLEARTTMIRGVENGYAVVRSAREGLMTVSDAYGRILAEKKSISLPGSMLLAKLAVADQVPVLYTRIGNLFGWICVATSVFLISIGRRQLSQELRT
jgi:apolipoprotein N-acyltransferase